MTTPSDQLRHGLRQLSLALPEDAQKKLLAYVAALRKWNRVFNLTAIDADHQIISHHILDSLAILPDLPGSPLLDMGTGAGVPGLVLAIARPEFSFSLLESNGKKVRFLKQTLHDLEIRNATVIHGRIEDFHPAQPFRALMARALGKVSDMLTACQHLLTGENVFLAMKGQYPEAELQALPPGFEVRSVKRIEVPGIEAMRHLVIIARHS